MKYNLINSSGIIVGEISIPVYERITSNLKTKIENEETKKYNSNPDNKKTFHIFLEAKAQKPKDFEKIEKEDKRDFLTVCKLPRIIKLTGKERLNAIAAILEWEIKDVEWFDRVYFKEINND